MTKASLFLYGDIMRPIKNLTPLENAYEIGWKVGYADWVNGTVTQNAPYDDFKTALRFWMGYTMGENIAHRNARR